MNLEDKAETEQNLKGMPMGLLKTPHVRMALQLINCLWTENYIKFMKLLNQNASYLQACLLKKSLDNIRMKMVEQVKWSVQEKVNLEKFKEWLLMDNLSDCKSFLEHKMGL